jgi:hypothetical protein
MNIISQYTDMAGKIRATCRLNLGELISLKFQTQPTQAYLDSLEAQYIEAHALDNVQQVTFNLLDHADLIREFVVLVKANPTVTLAQYNNWLGTKTWYQSAVIRYFVFTLATILAAKADLTLTTMTETAVLGKLRDWIVATDGKKIAKIVYGSNG